MILFLESILSGVIASFLTILFLEFSHKYRETRFYQNFLGKYIVSEINGPIIDGEVIELSYIGPKLIKAVSKVNGTLLWESKIVISSSNPHHGEGVYSYCNKHDFGLHSILISPDMRKISVHFRNLSHRDGRYGGVLWIKKDTNTTSRQGALSETEDAHASD